MNKFEIDQKSLHWRLASVYGGVTRYDVANGFIDMCTYIRKVIATALWLIVITLFGGGFIAVCAGDALAWWAAMIVHGTFFQANVPGAIFTSLLFMIVGLIMIVVINEAGASVRSKLFVRRMKEEAPPGFIKQAYSSWKDKYCMKVAFKSEHTDSPAGG